MFEDGSDEAEFTQEVGDESTPGFMQAAVFLVWAKNMLEALSQEVESMSHKEGELFPMTENEAICLVHFICQTAGYPVVEAADLDRGEWEDMLGFSLSILDYLKTALNDQELMGEMYPDGQADINLRYLNLLTEQLQSLDLFS